MPLKIKDRDEELELSPSEWNSVNVGDGHIALANPDRPKILISYALTVDKGKTSPDDYTIFIFKNECISEKDIFQLSEDTQKETIGYIFSIQAMMSQEHDYAQDKYFLRYALKAFYKLLRQDDGIPFITPDSNLPDFKLTDFYPEDSIILILWNERLKQIEGFDINHYLPFLYRYGYRHIKDEYRLSGTSHRQKEMEREVKRLEKEMKKLEIALNKVNSGDSAERIKTKIKELENEINDLNEIRKLEKRIVLKPISKDLENEDYIIQLVIDLLAYQDHPLVIFHLLYQVIELLMPKIAMKKLKEFTAKVENEPEYTSLSNMRDHLEELQEIQKEKGNIKTLFESSRPFSDNQDQKLKSECNKFLEKQQTIEKKIEEPAEYLYKVRNLIVHNYRNLSDESKRLLDEKINVKFEKLLIDLLINFKT